MDELIDKVIEQIQEDIGLCEFAPLEELLRATPKENLISFLSEALDDLEPEMMARFRSL